MQPWVMGETALRQKDSELYQAVHTASLTMGLHRACLVNRTYTVKTLSRE